MGALMTTKSKKEKKAAPAKVTESFAKKWAVFSNGDGTYKIQEIYTFSHMWYGRLDIQKKCKELILNNKKGADKELAEKLKQILSENSSPGK